MNFLTPLLYSCILTIPVKHLNAVFTLMQFNFMSIQHNKCCDMTMWMPCIKSDFGNVSLQKTPCWSSLGLVLLVLLCPDLGLWPVFLPASPSLLPDPERPCSPLQRRVRWNAETHRNRTSRLQRVAPQFLKFWSLFTNNRKRTELKIKKLFCI